MNDGLRVPELFHALLDRGQDYDAIVVSPYLFWTSFACGLIAPERTILRPCLHDEPEARFELFEPLFNGVARLWVNTDPELALLDDIAPGHAPASVIGEPGRSLPMPVALMTMLPGGSAPMIASLRAGSWLQMYSNAMSVSSLSTIARRPSSRPCERLTTMTP